MRSRGFSGVDRLPVPAAELAAAARLAYRATVLSARSWLRCAPRLGLLTVALALLAGSAAGAARTAPGPARAAPARMLIGYYVGYERDLMPPDEIEWDALTHIAVGAVLPKRNGQLNLGFDLGPGEGPGFARDLAKRAHAQRGRSDPDDRRSRCP